MKNTLLCITAAAAFFTAGCIEKEGRVNGVELDKNEATLNLGESLQLVATVKPEDADEKTVYWRSEQPEYVTVKDGRITAVALTESPARIRVSTKEGEFDAWCSVSVTSVPVTGVSLNKTELKLGVGYEETLTATIAPTNATFKTVTWNSSNTAVATVTEGKITALTVGTAVITATSQDGGKTASCNVTVETRLPVVTTGSASSILGTTATVSGNVTDAGAPAYTQKGICWSTSPSPTVNGDKMAVSGSGTGYFSASLSGLSEFTTYYARAYATNALGTVYGEQISFKTIKIYSNSATGNSSFFAVYFSSGYGATLGEQFVTSESGVLTSVRIRIGRFDDAVARSATVQIYNSSRVLIGSSSTFYVAHNETTPDGWITVPLNNIPYSGTFYVMVNVPAAYGYSHGIIYYSSSTNWAYQRSSTGTWSAYSFTSSGNTVSSGTFSITAYATLSN